MDETLPKVRRVRAFVYMDVYKLGILVGDWVVIGAVAFFGMVLNYLFPVTYGRAPVGLIGLLFVLGATYGLLYYLRHGRRRGYIDHRLSAFYWRHCVSCGRARRAASVKRVLDQRAALRRERMATDR